MFEKAARLKLRFPYPKVAYGLTVEDLWDMDVESLDAIFKNLNSNLKQKKKKACLERKAKSKKKSNFKYQL